MGHRKYHSYNPYFLFESLIMHCHNIQGSLSAENGLFNASIDTMLMTKGILAHLLITSGFMLDDRSEKPSLNIYNITRRHNSSLFYHA